MAMDAEWSVCGATELAAKLRAGAARLPELVETVVEKSANDLVMLTQRNASGRPGPNAPTSDYRGSWRAQKVEEHSYVRFSGHPESITFAVGTDRPQANRLEHGFVGVDSIGRHYDQPPYPHHGPAVDAIRPIFDAAMEQAAKSVVS